jgi:hypothetical protein
MSLAAALLAFQAEAPTLSKNAAGQVGSRNYKYVDLHSIVETITPLLAKHGLTWTTRPTGTHDAPTLTYELLWEGNPDEDTAEDRDLQAIAGEMPLYLPEHPTSQTLGSAITYARRYALTAVLNLVADEDDDGQAATSAPARSYGKVTTYDAAHDNLKEATDKQKGRVRAEATKAGVKKRDAWFAFTKHEFGQAIPVEELTWAQASYLIDRLPKGAIPTGESDVPSQDAPQHEKVPQDDTLPFT